MNELELAKHYHRKAKLAEEKKDFKTSSKYYFKASSQYASADQKFMQKFCEATGWYLNSFQFQKSIEGLKQIAMCMEKAILANNSALEYVEIGDRLYNKTIGNIRFQEGLKYNALANMEIKKAIKTSSLRKALHLGKAAGFKLCSARSKFELRDIKIEGNMQTGYEVDIARYLNNKSLFFYHRAWAEKELGNFFEALNIYKEASDTLALAISLFKKVLETKYISAIAENQIAAEELQKKIKKIISELEAKVPIEKKYEKKPPNLRIILKTYEGLVKNLFTPLFIYIKNNGEGTAKDITIDLVSYFEGDTLAGVQTIPPNSNHLHSMAIKPVESGEDIVKILASYHDYAGRKYEMKREVLTNIGKPNQERAKGKILFDLKQDN